MKLTLVIEGSKGSGTVQKIIGMMRTHSLDQIIADPEIEQVFRPLYERHLRSLEMIKRKAVTRDGVIYFDLVEEGADVAIRNGVLRDSSLVAKKICSKKMFYLLKYL